ncbi:hypothetical protein [Sphingomicrobium flavum]|uniref:hypothetical protein n=1 Tax=Sphingomicrobium flavum TaxID=1229164 RepID=UPI0021ADE3CF|nr:hypothetical protein [Sphingomicrobium flavum]
MIDRTANAALLSESEVDWDRAYDLKPQDDEIEAKQHSPIRPPGAKTASTLLPMLFFGPGFDGGGAEAKDGE